MGIVYFGGDEMNIVEYNNTRPKDNLIIDAFAGGGGASVGIEMATGRGVDIAVNHDPGAITMHMVNHHNTLHLTEDIFKVDLDKYVQGRHVALLWASPCCQHFSRARGGVPLNEQLRILPWSVYKHSKTIKPDVIIMENVPEIQTWGPLDKDGKPIKERSGEEYEKFINAMKTIGYEVESRELVAADYGAPTIRKRWFAIFRRDGKPIIWPDATHSQNGFGGKPKWKSAASVIDCTNIGSAISKRKKPLAEKTLERINKGIDKFYYQNPKPFITEIKNPITKKKTKVVQFIM
jgi:DNA (cytosine-5)-methyltransferase 1